MSVAVVQKGGASRRDPDAFEEFYRDSYQLLASFFARRGCSEEERRDLLQETYLRAYRSFDRFRGESKRSTWLMTIAANLWLNRIRDSEAAKRAGQEVSVAEDGQALPASQDHPLDGVIHGERRRLLRSAIDDLPKEMRRVVFLRVYQEKRFRDIADLLGVSEQTARSQYSRAGPRLRSILAERYPDLEIELERRGG